MAECKNQHYVPQHYLSRWAKISNPYNVNECLPFILDKDTNKIKQKNIKNLFSESYFYNVEILTESEIDQLHHYFYSKIHMVNKGNEVNDSVVKNIIDKVLFTLSQIAKSKDKNVLIEKEFFSKIEPAYNIIDAIIHSGKPQENIQGENAIYLHQYITSLFFRTKSFRANIPKIYGHIKFVTDDTDKFFPYLLLLNIVLFAALNYQEYIHIFCVNARIPLITSDNPLIWTKDYIVLPISPRYYLKFVKAPFCSNGILKEEALNNYQYRQANKYLIAETEKDFHINLQQEISRILYTNQL